MVAFLAILDADAPCAVRVVAAKTCSSTLYNKTEWVLYPIGESNHCRRSFARDPEPLPVQRDQLPVPHQLHVLLQLAQPRGVQVRCEDLIQKPCRPSDRGGIQRRRNVRWRLIQSLVLQPPAIYQKQVYYYCRQATDYCRSLVNLRP